MSLHILMACSCLTSGSYYIISWLDQILNRWSRVNEYERNTRSHLGQEARARQSRSCRVVIIESEIY
jgi:hypothetical protein